jgi:hypothetical protein
MANRLMETIRHALGMTPSAPPSMNDEQSAVAERLRRIALRQKAVDIQVDVIRADTHDARPRR